MLKKMIIYIYIDKCLYIYIYTKTLFIIQDSTMFKSSLLCAWLSVDQYVYDGLSKCLFLVLLINRNSMRAASCLPLKNITYLDDVKTWKFFVTFGNLSKTTGIG